MLVFIQRTKEYGFLFSIKKKLGDDITEQKLG